MPTDEELERAMASACGWTAEDIERGIHPDYCIDRNTLPEVWQAIEARGQWACYLNYLRHYDPRNAERGITHTGTKWHAVTAPCRIRVIAALHALGAWQDEWDMPAATENDRAVEEMDVPPE
jgi:hypothetical protein